MELLLPFVKQVIVVVFAFGFIFIFRDFIK